MKVGDRVYSISRKEYGTICKIQGKEYFVSFADGIGFWFYRGELTEG